MSYDKRYNQKVWQEFLEEYGSKCQCCGESNPAFLTVEHLDRTGNRNRRGASAIMQIRKLGWPKDTIALLCFNCNCGKARMRQRGFGNLCPHEARPW